MFRKILPKRARAIAPCLCQTLESRRLFATVNWDGGPTGNGTDFLTAANWAGDVLPQAADTAVIGATGTNPTITISGTPAVQTITSSRNLQMTGGTLSGGTVALSGGAAILASTNLGRLSNVAITGDVLLNTADASLVLSGNTSFTTARLTTGGVNLRMAAGYTLNSPVVVEGAAGGQRRIELAFGGGGTVTIGASGVVRVAAGAGGPLFIGEAQISTLINNGLITAEASGQSLTIQNSNYTNSATTQVTTGTLSINSPNWSNPGSITATGSTLVFGGNWSNAGTLSVNNSTLNLGGAFSTSGFNFAGFTRTSGTVNLTGTINNTGNTINLNGASGSWNLAGGRINDGSLVFSGGSSLMVTTSNGTLSNVAVTGDLLLNTNSAVVTVAGNTTFTAARLTAGGVNLAMGPGYTLNSPVIVEGAAAGTRNITLGSGGVGGATFGPSAVVRLAPGSGGGLSFGNVQVAALTNNGLISAEAAGQQIVIQNSGGLTNNGTMQVTGAGTLSINNGWTNTGTVTGTAGTFNLGGTLNATGGIGTFTTSALTVNLSGTINNNGNTIHLNGATGSWNLTGGRINDGSLVYSGGSSLIFTTVPNATLSNVAITGDLLLNTNNTAVILAGNTSFTTARLSASDVNLAMGPNYTLNSPVIVEGAAGGTRNITLGFGGVGPATFGPSAVVRLAAGSGGGLRIGNFQVAALTNNGLISAEAAGQQILIQNSGLTNNGTMQVTSGALSINTGWTNPGTVTGTSGTLNLGGTLNATAGIGTFTTSALAVNLSGTVTNTGNTLTLNAATGSWNLVGGRINEGSLVFSGGSTLVLTSTPNGQLSSVAVTGDLLLNTNNAFVLLNGNTSFTAARLSASDVNLAMGPNYTLNSPVIVEGAAGGTRNITLGFGGVAGATFGPSAIVRLAAGSGGGLRIGNFQVAALTNNGLIAAEAAGQQILIQNSGLTNNGTLRATNGSALTVNTSFGPSSGHLLADGMGSALSIQAGTYTINQAANATNNAMIYFRGTSTKAATFNASGRFVLDYTGAANSPFAQIKADVISGYAGGNWNGPGINSTAAAVTPRTAVGYAEASTVLSATGGNFAGVNVDGTAVLVRYTLAGDANLSGNVDIADFARLGAKFNQAGEWTDGDSNYNGQVEIGDFSLLAANFNRSSPASLPQARPGAPAWAPTTGRTPFATVRIGEIDNLVASADLF
jgi:hypothetical protein